jgi:hypothetical protein
MTKKLSLISISGSDRLSTKFEENKENNQIVTKCVKMQDDLTAKSCTRRNVIIDIKTKWKCGRSRKIEFKTLFTAAIGTLCILGNFWAITNAMPVPKIQQRSSLTSAMVSIFSIYKQD